jgi:hypothetical protein
VAQKGNEFGKPSRGERELVRESLIDETVSTLRIKRAIKSEQGNYTKIQTTRRKFLMKNFIRKFFRNIE